MATERVLTMDREGVAAMVRLWLDSKSDSIEDLHAAILAALAAEREACANIAEMAFFDIDVSLPMPQRIARDIRMRGK